MLEEKVQDSGPHIEVANAVDKVVAMQSLAMHHKVHIIKGRSNYLNRVQLDALKDVDEELHCGVGLFYEVTIEKVEELATYLTRKNQTVTVIGFTRDELIRFVVNNNVNGIDRFTKVGNALDFSYIWDGFNLFREFTRVIEIGL